ncbi:MAG: hypothetical protein E7311_04665 [Clostridiales bacterium]|nr:hypothetical protein [Clostridiales bacterium]
MSNKWILLILDLIIITLIGVSAIKGLTIKEGMTISSVKETMKLGDSYQVVLNSYDAELKKYEETVEKQKTAIKNFEQSKQKFEQIKNINSYETLVELAKEREFNIEALWIKLGLIAENNELTHAFNIKKSSQTSNYDINVELIGTYSGIRNFIDDIMMDMDLMFKAEDIIIVTEGANNLKATFVIKNINIVM